MVHGLKALMYRQKYAVVSQGRYEAGHSHSAGDAGTAELTLVSLMPVTMRLCWSPLGSPAEWVQTSRSKCSAWLCDLHQ